MPGECYLFWTPWGHISPIYRTYQLVPIKIMDGYCIPLAVLQIKPVCPCMNAYLAEEDLLKRDLWPTYLKNRLFLTHFKLSIKSLHIPLLTNSTLEYGNIMEVRVKSVYSIFNCILNFVECHLEMYFMFTMTCWIRTFELSYFPRRTITTIENVGIVLLKGLCMACYWVILHLSDPSSGIWRMKSAPSEVRI